VGYREWDRAVTDIDVLHAHEFIEGIGKAQNCVVSRSHRPVPMRYVWHHVLPTTCGGLSVSENLVSCCDSCHYAIHALLYQLKVNGAVTPSPGNNLARVALAQRGYQAAVAAGTVAKIPNEGG